MQRIVVQNHAGCHNEDFEFYHSESLQLKGSVSCVFTLSGDDKEPELELGVFFPVANITIKSEDSEWYSFEEPESEGYDWIRQGRNDPSATR